MLKSVEPYRIRSWAGTAGAAPKCRSIETSIAPTELENVEPGDGDRVGCLHFAGSWLKNEREDRSDGLPGPAVRDAVMFRQAEWLLRGAASVEAQRFLINKYRRPGMSNRDADLGGPVEAAGVLYVLRVKAPN